MYIIIIISASIYSFNTTTFKETTLQQVKYRCWSWYHYNEGNNWYQNTL